MWSQQWESNIKAVLWDVFSLCFPTGWFTEQTADLFGCRSPSCSDCCCCSSLITLSLECLWARQNCCLLGEATPPHTTRLDWTSQAQHNFCGDRVERGLKINPPRQHLRLHFSPLNSMYLMDTLHLGLVSLYCLVFCVVLPGRVASATTGMPDKPSSSSLSTELGPHPAEEVLLFEEGGPVAVSFTSQPQEIHRQNQSSSLYV